MYIFSIYDSKAELWLTPFFSTTPATGVRVFAQALTNPQQTLHQFPADFTLFEIGTFDPETGGIEMHTAKKNLGTGLDHQNFDEYHNPADQVVHMVKGKGN